MRQFSDHPPLFAVARMTRLHRRLIPKRIRRYKAKSIQALIHQREKLRQATRMVQLLAMPEAMRRHPLPIKVMKNFLIIIASLLGPLLLGYGIRHLYRSRKKN